MAKSKKTVSKRHKNLIKIMLEISQDGAAVLILMKSSPWLCRHFGVGLIHRALAHFEPEPTQLGFAASDLLEHCRRFCGVCGRCDQAGNRSNVVTLPITRLGPPAKPR